MIATDDFNRADSGDLGVNWTNAFTAVPATYKLLGVTSNQAKQQGAGSGTALAYYSAIPWAADQQSTCTVHFSATHQLGPAVRCSGTGSGTSAYVAIIRSDTAIDIVLGTNGVFIGGTILSLSGLTFADGDVIRLRAVGSLLSVFQNGIFLGSVENGSLTSGTPGLYAADSSVTLDDWEGADFLMYIPTGWESSYQVSGARSAGMVSSGMTN